MAFLTSNPFSYYERSFVWLNCIASSSRRLRSRSCRIVERSRNLCHAPARVEVRAADTYEYTASFVHPTAVVYSGALIEEGCEIGPYCVIGPNVSLGKSTKLHSHCVVEGRTTVGENCELFSHSVIGCKSQDRKHSEVSATHVSLAIGNDCVIREHVTINGGNSNAKESGITTIGDQTMLLIGSHIGHDCRIGNGVVVSNFAQIGGHSCIGDFSTVGAAATVRQFLNIGRASMIGGASAVGGHVLPYSLVSGNRAVVKGVNIVGLRRRKVTTNQIRFLQHALKRLKNLQGVEKHELASRAFDILSDAVKDGDVKGLGSVAELCSFVLGHGNQAKFQSEFQDMYEWGWQQRRLGIVI